MCKPKERYGCKHYVPGKKCYRCYWRGVLNYVLGGGLAVAMYYILGHIAGR